MISFSKKQLVEFLKSVGLKEKDCLVNGEVIDLFKLLKFKPKINDDGSRTLSPYEILRVSPKFRNGKEVPIVFAIKNRAKSIGKYKGQELVYYYKQNVVKNEKTIIETLKSKYRQAIYLGDNEMAKNYLSMIEGLSKDEAKDLIDNFYDYTKFYKRMKKQLILDLFAHFFLVYIVNNLTKIKKGLVKLDRVYRPYHQLEAEYEPVEFVPNNFETSFVPDIAANPEAFGIGNIEKIKIEKSESSPVTVDFTGDTAKIESGKVEINDDLENKPAETKPVEVDKVKTDVYASKPFEEKSEPKNKDEMNSHKQSFLKLGNIRKKKHISPIHRLFGLNDIEEDFEEEKATDKEKSEHIQKEMNIETKLEL